MILEWWLDDDGGGEVIIFKKDMGPSMEPIFKEVKRLFESLDELPEQWAEAIKEDGRRQGSLANLAEELEY